MTRVAVVSTSVNSEPAAYVEWAAGAHLIVAGDRNSPRTLERFVRDLGGTYLGVRDQRRWSWSETIGWNCVQRRNAAIMHAYEQDFDYVISVDDDNFPTPDVGTFIKEHIMNMRTHVRNTVGSSSGFLNTGVFCRPQFHQRGTPYGVSTDNPVVRKTRDVPHVVVSQAQVLGDPDCDAVERMCNAPVVDTVLTSAVITPGVYAAFNSQATVWQHTWLPVAAVLPHIGRYDDIFASFLFTRLARDRNATLFVGEPCVRQVRNPHDPVADLRAELWGMCHVFEFIGALSSAYVSADMPLWMAYAELIVAVSDVLPPQTIEFAKRWVQTWKET